MKIAILFFVAAIVGVSCDKTKPVPLPTETHPQMSYAELTSKIVAFDGHALIDADRDGYNDLLFNTMLLGDPTAQQDKHQWLVNSSFVTNLPVKDENVPLLNYGDSISVHNFSGYEWFNASTILLAQKIIDMVQQPWWEGEWKHASHHYLPFQLNKNDQLYNGWVEVSFSTSEEKLILHKVAVSLESNKKIIAGRLN